MAGARARQADHFCGHSAARQKTAPAAAAGAAVDADGANEVAVGGSGSRACGSADAWWSTSPAGRAQPGAAAQRRGKWRRNSPSVRSRVKGPESGGHDCPQSADPRRTERNRRKKAKKAAAQERFFASLGNIDQAVYREQAKDRIFERFYHERVRRLEGARPSP